MIKIDEDILELEHALYDESRAFFDFSLYSPVYMFTTENIAGYFSKLDFNNKKVLTVCGSGDHVLNAILLGAMDITVFDISSFAEYYLAFKIAAIKTLNYQQFISFFIKSDICDLENLDFGYNKLLLYDYFKLIKEKITDERIRYFWECAYKIKKNIGKHLHSSGLFVEHSCETLNCIKRHNLYGEVELYNSLREKLNKVNINFITSDILTLPNKLSSSYDLVITSNISDYLWQMYPKYYYYNKKLIKYKEFILGELGAMVKVDGNIQIAYLYNNMSTGMTGTYNEESDRTLRNKVFSEDAFSLLEFPGAYDHRTTDAVMIYTKRK